MDLIRQRVARALLAADRVLVTGHRNPDGDSVGSMLAASLILRRLGKDVTIYGPDPVPGAFLGLPSADTVVDRLGEDARFDLTLVLDVGSPVQMGPDVPPPPRCGVLVVLDHHLSATAFGDLRWHDPGAAATGLLVAALADHLQVTIDTELAWPLWCALYTDTGGFRYSSTDAASLRLAARLVEDGLDPWEISVQLFENVPLARQRLLGLCLDSLVLSPSGCVASLVITEAMLQQSGADVEMIDGIINYARSIAGVEVAVQVLEQGSQCRISLRSKGRVDVGSLAQRLGGGGHHNAAGAVVKGSPAKVQEQVLALLREAPELGIGGPCGAGSSSGGHSPEETS